MTFRDPIQIELRWIWILVTCCLGAQVGCLPRYPGDAIVSATPTPTTPTTPTPTTPTPTTPEASAPIASAATDSNKLNSPSASLRPVSFSGPVDRNQSDLPSSRRHGLLVSNAVAIQESGTATSEDGASASDTQVLSLDEVVAAVYRSYPLLESARNFRQIATGEHLAAHGAFDLKLKGASENGPVGFYETYRQGIGLARPLYAGSDVWGGYRIGRGNFQPWYQERQTNDAGEFKAGINVPLIRNRTIDERRANLWRTNQGRQLAELDIQAQSIGFVWEASYAFWEWVAAGRDKQIAERVLELAESRTQRIESQVEAGLIDPPELTDNLRLVAGRRAKVLDANRKLRQKAAKLSLFLRDMQGQPIIPDELWLPSFPEPKLADRSQVESDIRGALSNRPDLRALDVLRQQFEIDLRQANNLRQPDVSAVVWGSQDIGNPSSSKGDKSPLVLEAGLYLDVPVQRRKARGKQIAVRAKLRQIAAKRGLTEDKIRVEVEMAYAAWSVSFERVQQTRQAVEFAEELAERERRNFEEGASDLLKVTLREQYAAESAVKELDALLQYHQALADYRAAIGFTPTN